MKDLSEMGRFAAEAIKHDTVSFVAWRHDGSLLTANPPFYTLTGYSHAEADSMMWPADFTDKELGKLIEKAMVELSHKEKSCRLEGNIIKKGGVALSVNIFINACHDPGTGELVFFAFIVDVSMLKEREQLLLMTRFALEHFADPSIWMDAEGHVVYVNEMACKSLGYRRDELLSMRIWQVDPVSSPEKFFELWEFARKAGSVQFNSMNKSRDGRQFPIEIHCSYIRFDGKEQLICFARDITERRRAEEALVQSEEKFRVLAELSPSAIFLYQGDKLIYANPASVRYTGYSMQELLTKNFWDMIHPDYREMVKAYGLARQKGEPVPARYEVKYIAKNGESRWAEFTAGIIEYRGKPAGIVTAYDVTDRKHNEIALRDAKAQAELYVDLMGHDINNMNMAAMGFLELACDKLKSQGSLGKEDLDLISNARDSLAGSSNLIGSVRKLQKERKGILRPGYICLGHILTEVKERYSQVPGRDIVISYNAICDCCVRANELLIDVFANLVGNAIKHSSGSLAININLRTTEEYGTIYCKTTIEDTGPGIPDEQKKGIFARAGKEYARLTGKGLGLYLVKTLVDDFHGMVWVEDRIKGDYRKGSRFVVLLPAVVGRGEDATEGEALM